MMPLALSIEPARPADADAIEKLHARAFGPGRYARTAFRVREQADAANASGFLARVASLLVGSVLLTPIRIGKHAGLMLGPLTVEPAFEGRGIGAALLKRAAEEAESRDVALILLVGDAAYYGRHGYRHVPMGQIRLPGPVDPARLLALEVRPNALSDVRGEVRGA
jgi:predicted N-acetyltransferase YhbS